MGMTFRRYLSGQRIYGCSNWFALASTLTVTDSFSKAFNGQHGRAYLFQQVVNVIEGDPSERTMTTGDHIVRDIYCCKCGVTLGWKYDYAYDNSQKYKEGKFILERNLLVDVK